MVQPLENSMRFLKKLKVELPNDPAVTLSSIHTEKTLMQKAPCTPLFAAGLFTIAKIGVRPKCPSTGKWIKKMW